LHPNGYALNYRSYMRYIDLEIDTQRQLIEKVKKLYELPEQSIEKDLWVTQVLHALFSLPVSDKLIFKGGTSLSKAWNLIDRFSEDIDLAIDPVFLGLPEGDPTKKQIKKLRKASSLYVAEQLAEMLRVRFAEMGLSEWLTVGVQPNGEGDNTYPEPRQLYVHYRSVFAESKGYLRPDIVLEISARSLMEPVAPVAVSSLLSQHLPILDIAPVPVVTAVAGKTMIEKMFLLHEMFSVEGHGKKAERKSRHLYDLYKMMSHPFADEAIKNNTLWENIRHHREIYTSVNGMDYTPDVRKRLVLVPRPDILNAWKADYEQMMSSMIYGDKPSWDELIVAMTELQERVRCITHN